MNLAAQFGVSLVITAGMWLVGHLVRRRVAQLARDAGIEWPAHHDVGMEVSPSLLHAIAITDWLHRIRFGLLGPLLCLNFVCVNWFAEAII